MEVVDAVGLDDVVVVAGIVEVLLADEFGDEGDVEILDWNEVEFVASDNIRREGDVYL